MVTTGCQNKKPFDRKYSPAYQLRVIGTLVTLSICLARGGVVGSPITTCAGHEPAHFSFSRERSILSTHIAWLSALNRWFVLRGSISEFPKPEGCGSNSESSTERDGYKPGASYQRTRAGLNVCREREIATPRDTKKPIGSPAGGWVGKTGYEPSMGNCQVPRPIFISLTTPQGKEVSAPR